MRKSLILFLCLLLLMIGGLGAAAVTVKQQETAVRTEQFCYYGDPAYAEGISVHERVRSLNRMFWDIDMTLGAEPTATAEFEVTKSDVYEEYYGESAVITLAALEGLSLYNPENFLTELEKLLLKLIEELPNGQESTLTVNLGDYFDYYPIGTQLWSSTSTLMLSDDDEYNETGLNPFNEMISEYFRIPVLENNFFSLTVCKDKNGELLDYQQDYPDGSDGVSLDGHSCGTDTCILFSINNKSWNGEILDMSLVPGGYGIYRVPCSIVDDGLTTLVYNEISTVYSLDEREDVVSLIASADGKSVLCTTVLDGKSFMAVLEPDTGELRQRFELKGVTDEFEAWYVREQTDGSIICTDSTSVLLIEKTADGLYEQTAAVREPYIESESYDYETGYWHYQPTELASHFPVGLSVTNLHEDYMAIMRDGDRLIIADPSFMMYEGCAFVLIVYENSKPVYLGYYTSSLDVPLAGSPCRLDGQNSLVFTAS